MKLGIDFVWFSARESDLEHKSLSVMFKLVEVCLIKHFVTIKCGINNIIIILFCLMFVWPCIIDTVTKTAK